MLLQILGVVFFLIGKAIRYMINRRNFGRNNQYGTQGFNSYEHHLFTVWSEKFGRFIGGILMLAGIFFFAVGVFNNVTAKKHKQHQQEQKTDSVYKAKVPHKGGTR